MARQAASSSGMPDDGRAALTAQLLRIRDDGGRLVLDDDPNATAIPLRNDGAGRLVLDDTATVGLRLAATPTRILAYD